MFVDPRQRRTPILYILNQTPRGGGEAGALRAGATDTVLSKPGAAREAFLRGFRGTQHSGNAQESAALPLFQAAAAETLPKLRLSASNSGSVDPRFLPLPVNYLLQAAGSQSARSAANQHARPITVRTHPFIRLTGNRDHS